jgi:hypothetical protein
MTLSLGKAIKFEHDSNGIYGKERLRLQES